MIVDGLIHASTLPMAYPPSLGPLEIVRRARCARTCWWRTTIFPSFQTNQFGASIAPPSILTLAVKINKLEWSGLRVYPVPLRCISYQFHFRTLYQEHLSQLTLKVLPH